VPPQQRRTTSDGASLGEVVRRIEDIVARLDEMQRGTAEREARFEKTYVRSDVFQAVQTTDAVQIRGIEGELHSLAKRYDATEARISTIEERRRQDRALVLSGLAFPLIVALLTALVLTGRM
jgi:predicted RNA-binding protein